jgi:hypothetical protein
LSQLATAKLKSENLGIQGAINDYEYACMILSKLENENDNNNQKDLKKISSKLDKLYL